MHYRSDILAALRSNVGPLWPPLVRGEAAELAALLLILEQTQRLSAQELAHRQSGQLALLLPHLAQQSAQFRARLAHAGLEVAALTDPERLRQLPLLSRRDLQVAPAHLHCRAVPTSHLPLGETSTSGATGEPITVRRSYVTQQFWRALNLRTQFNQGQNLAARCSAIRPHLAGYGVMADSSALVDNLFIGGPLQTIPIETDIGQQVAYLADFRPERLVVFPNNLDALTRYCQRHDQRLPDLRQIITLSETLSPTVRAAATTTFEVQVFDMYSAQEVGMIADQCPHSGLYHVSAETLIVEVVQEDGGACAEGESGRVVVTDLLNFATPVVRYALGDFAEVGGACGCGRGAPTLRRILGRARNILVRPDGTRSWPTLGGAGFRAVAPINQYQFVQRDRDRVELRLVSETPITAAQEAQLTVVVQQALGYPFHIDFSYFDQPLARSAGGKFEEFINLLPPEIIYDG